MKFVDEVTIHVQAGNGGHAAVCDGYGFSFAGGHWPATPGAFDTTHNGPADSSNAARDVFVARTRIRNVVGRMRINLLSSHASVTRSSPL